MRPTEVSGSFSKAFQHHHRWLKRHQLLSRPWFMLASAPQPTFPESFPTGVVHAYVKHAGRSARIHGLPSADVTWLSYARAKDEDDVPLNRGHIILVRGRLMLPGRIHRALGIASARNVDMLRRERDDYTISVVGSLFSDGRKDSRPSSTIPMLCFALAHGVPKIILAGMSFREAGYAYDQSEAPRKHVTEDIAALKIVAERYPRVSTTEQGVHEATGIPLYAG